LSVKIENEIEIEGNGDAIFSNSTSYHNFINAIRSPATQKGYRNSLKRYMNATLDSDGNSVSFGQKISYCLNNKSVPFLNLCRRSSGFEIEVAITPNIRAELRKNDRSTSVMTMNALA
jgi:hypothetical protein